jgi:hypothetical protein
MNLRKKTCFLCMVGLLILFVQTVPAAQFQETPFNANTEVYYEANLTGDDLGSLAVDIVDRLQYVDFLEPYMKQFISETGVDPGKEMLSWFGSRIRFGIVGTEKDSVIRNDLSKVLTHNRKVSELKETVARMRTLRNKIDDYTAEKGQLPKRLSDVMSDGRINPPGGGKFVYRTTSENSYEISAPQNQFINLGLPGNLPRYDSETGFTGDRPEITKTMKLRNYLMVIDVKNIDNANKFFLQLSRVLTKFENLTGNYFQKIRWGKNILYQGENFNYTFEKNTLLISDKLDILKTAIMTMEGKQHPIDRNPVYQNFIKTHRVEGKTNEIMFVNLKKINLTPNLLGIKEPSLFPIINNLHYLGYKAVYDKNGVVGDVSLQFTPGSQIPILDDFIYRTRPFNEGLVEELPAGIPAAISGNFGEIWNFVNAVANQKKEADEVTHVISSMAAMITGMDFERDILRSTTGEVALSFRSRDFLFEGIRFLLEMRSPFTDPGIQEEPDEEPAADMVDSTSGNLQSLSGKIQKNIPPGGMEISAVGRIPVTIYVNVRDRKNFEQLLSLVRSRGEFEEMIYNGVPIYTSQRLSYTLYGNLLVLQTAGTTGNIRRFIDLRLAGADKLGKTSCYHEFRKGIRGRILGISYLDVELTSTIMKGALMFLLPEFSDYAVQLGRFRENWSSLSVSPREIQFRFMFTREPVDNKVK